MPGRGIFLLVTLAAAVSIGCGGGSGGWNGARNLHSRKVPAGQIAVSPSTIDFGKVAVGKKKSQKGTLTAGDSSIAVTSADWSGPGYSISGITFPVTVPAGQSVHFEVSFAPQTTGNAPGKIKFITNAENSTRAALAGSGVRPHSVTLSWRSANAEIAGYNIYRAPGPEGPYTRINSKPHPIPTFTDTSVDAGLTYYYMATSVNKHGRESKYSNQIRVEIPNS
jgi:hypothetical protein